METGGGGEGGLARCFKGGICGEAGTTYWNFGAYQEVLLL